MFSPQSLPKPDIRARVTDLGPDERMPWEPGSRLDGQPADPGKAWRHEVFGGVYELGRVRDTLVTLYDKDDSADDQREPVPGQSALFACTVDADGVLVEGSAVLSACAWAIWRARRVVVVGDPLQLEPVVTLPLGGQRALLRLFGVDQEWTPEFISVQQVADRLAPRGTWLPRPGSDGSGAVWVGTPLRVHRRCDRPMFDISNEIAYDGLMVYGTQDREPFHGRSVWYNVQSGDARGHWIPAEGVALRQILSSLRSQGIRAADLRVISPFRQVVAGAMTIHREVFPDAEVDTENRWKWVGTVHTMQGKEADVVILVLGGNPDRPNARKFATETPNLLNVAVTRARRRLYVIGDRGTWASERYFDVLAAYVEQWQPASRS